MKACLLLVAIDNDVGTRLDGLAGQCPGFFRVILVGDGIGIEIYGCCTAVVELYPLVGEFIDVIHDAVDV